MAADPLRRDAVADAGRAFGADAAVAGGVGHLYPEGVVEGLVDAPAEDFGRRHLDPVLVALVRMVGVLDGDGFAADFDALRALGPAPVPDDGDPLVAFDGAEFVRQLHLPAGDDDLAVFEVGPAGNDVGVTIRRRGRDAAE